jgi:CBS domain-containing protein
MKGVPIMKVGEIMTPNPVCCLPTDTAQKVARILCDNSVGSVPVVADQQSRRLIGMITDRDLCCSVMAEGLDPKSTTIESYFTADPVRCRDGDNLAKCEEAMQEHQIRRVPVVDEEGCCIGVVSQADLALKEQPEKFSKTVAEISKPESKTA